MGFLNILVTVLIASGLFFFFAGALGILRFPDFYSRLHPAGKLDTMGQFATMVGMAIYTAQDLSLNGVLTALKIMLIVVFVFITSPTATHAIVDAGVRAGMLPWTKESQGGRE
jgi:multicomponent Na+:H+ antiporter subunit G